MEPKPVPLTARLVVLLATTLSVRTLEAGPPCPTDVDRDGTVAVSDLLLVLLSWGPYAPCPPDIPEDVNGDCVVDVQDLLEVVITWGPCSAPARGACCLDGDDCIETSMPDCDNLDGVFLGDGTQCPPGACGAGVVGACCTPAGNCLEVDIPACAALGGSYQGAGVTCEPGLCR